MMYRWNNRFFDFFKQKLQVSNKMLSNLSSVSKQTFINAAMTDFFFTDLRPVEISCKYNSDMLPSCLNTLLAYSCQFIHSALMVQHFQLFEVMFLFI